jgi:hypothetical protein
VGIVVARSVRVNSGYAGTVVCETANVDSGEVGELYVLGSSGKIDSAKVHHLYCTPGTAGHLVIDSSVVVEEHYLSEAELIVAAMRAAKVI